MATGHVYKANYDYVELTVERREDEWHLILKDTRHGESVEHDETFPTAADAQDAALALAEHHISIEHNDTLLTTRGILSWRQS
jgi:hypothetical protein